ncbi:hypothetical protein GGI35DRAFT_472881 [Trichoderma velutinum]
MEIDEEVMALDIDLNLLASIIRQDALPLFEKHCQEIHHFWSWLTRKTFIPANVAIGDSIITSAFAIVDDAILYSGDCVGQGNASILIDLYVKAQTELFSPKVLRQKVQNRVRIAKRWADLISGSIFIATAYNDKAEMMM